MVAWYFIPLAFLIGGFIGTAGMALLCAFGNSERELERDTTYWVTTQTGKSWHS